jgi:hypothetical protein
MPGDVICSKLEWANECLSGVRDIELSFSGFNGRLDRKMEREITGDSG